MTNRIQLGPEQKARLLDPQQLPTTVMLGKRSYTPLAPVAAGSKGVVWKVRDEFGRDRALKLCIREDYEDRSYLQEVQRAASLESHVGFARLVDAGLVNVKLGDHAQESFVGFLEEWVDGYTLKAFVTSHPDVITISFILAYVGQLADALQYMQQVGLRHDDLHSGNIMLRRPDPTALRPLWALKIIDTGSVKPMTTASTKPKDDHRHFVDHLILLWNTVVRGRRLSVRDRRFLEETVGLLKSMLDDDPSIALREPRQVLQQFELAYTRSERPDSAQVLRPTDPFEFLSAEHIADDRLLVELFARSCPYLSKVDGPDPCLVTGPRGCGKSTIFRWLSLRAHLHKPLSDIKALKITGFYLSCASDLQNRLAWIRTDGLARRFRREIVHYFNMLLAREVIHTLIRITERDDRGSYWGFGQGQENDVCDFFTNMLQRQGRPRLQGVPRLVQVLESIEVELFETHAEMLRGRNSSFCTSESFLGDMTSLLTRHIPFFRERRIAFLVDDFSTHRLSDPVQVVLNQVIWERRSTHVFKLSSEKYGAVLTDSLGATVDVSREMVEVDCGREYIALDDRDQVARAREFAVELLNNRLVAAQYHGSAQDLIGHSEWEEGGLARALALKEKGRRNDQYHGLECIANVCSGDVSTLLLVYRRIFENGHITQESKNAVAKHVQHDAIVSVSRELLEAIKPHFPVGAEMYAVVNAFGKLARNILQHGRWQKKGGATTPTQCPRIELDQDDGAAVETLSQEQQLIARELIRRAIFIEMEPGLSRHRNVTTLRWNLRRVYLPAFGAALSKNDAVKKKTDWLKYFITDPEGACTQVWRSWPKGDGVSDDLPLFSHLK